MTCSELSVAIILRKIPSYRAVRGPLPSRPAECREWRAALPVRFRLFRRPPAL